ncbi:MAG: hypothetical protein HY076_06775 [Candidatus Eisenbacteria bacterium]|uniref:DUF2219 family protein n=1 Tax=Eiseniibacteriota bacterium TaxID=2212470 RepID=A0A9D6QK58_UNCEI|nr:hypothetical protein [Candidatus Eisenbacteria bacterium]MBI3539960.1 hypothetical protein [Candidatus Eisenbacteria bacterium]
MRARTALSVLVLAAVAVPFLVVSAAADPWTFSKGEWSSTIEGSLFSAPTYYDATGARLDLGYTTEQRVLRATSELGWKNHVSVLFGLPAMSVTRSAGTASATMTGLQDVRLGVKIGLMNGATAAAVRFDWNAPLGYDRKLGAYGLVLGDGLIYADSLGAAQTVDGLQQLGAHLELGTAVANRAFLQGSIGYGYRYFSFGKREKTVEALRERDDAGKLIRTHASWGLWADQLLTSADLGLWVSRTVLVGGRYRGVNTLSEGPLFRETNQQLAGPIVLVRVDDRLDMLAGSWSTASGKNALHYDQFYVSVAFHQTKLNRLQGFSGGSQAH